MSPLRAALERYVIMRRGLGCKFQHQERRLRGHFGMKVECLRLGVGWPGQM